MPWELTTPITVGDLDPNGPYTQVKIVKEMNDSVQKRLRVSLGYGNTVNGDWVEGLVPNDKQKDHIIDGEDYNTLITTHTTLEDELTYDAVKRALYAALASAGVIDPGSVV